MKIPLAIPLKLSEIIHAMQAVPVGFAPSDFTVKAIATHSEEANAGDLFFAIRGDSFDGHDFIPTLLPKGVFVVSEKATDGTLLVKDSLEALGNLATYYKSRLPSLKKTVTITGSVGKSTVKNFLSRLLGSFFHVHSTPGNFNNRIGLPLTILSAPHDTEILVLEMGTNQVGEIEILSQIARPDIAVITCIGTAHIGQFGSRRVIAEEKAKIQVGMPKNGLLFVPAEETLLSRLPNTRTVSILGNADISLIAVHETDKDTNAVFYGKENTFTLSFPIPGKGALTDLCYALGVAESLEIPGAVLLNAISKIGNEDFRMQTENIFGIEIMDDSYNASLESVMQGLDILKMKHGKRKVVLLGDILELGTFSEEIHKSIGFALPKYGVEYGCFFGVYAPYYQAGALSGGMKPDALEIHLDTASPEEAAKSLVSSLSIGDILYCKASHNVGLSRVISLIKNELKSKG